MPQHKGVGGINPSNSLITREKNKKFTRKSVLKMLAVMEASSQNAGPSSSNSNNCSETTTPNQGVINAQEFLSSGRTGRRNALPDILGQHATVTSSDLPSKLQGLTTKDKEDNKKEEPSTSKG